MPHNGSFPLYCHFYHEIFEKKGWASLDFEDCPIGGQDITVEIDESKLGKNKYHPGHLVSGAWVLSGAFLVEVPDRTAETLINIIRRYVLLGSKLIIHNRSSTGQMESVKTPPMGTSIALKMKKMPRNRTNSFNEDEEL
ncbi:hypothetical protein RF11_02499 [Thelohanellus kitauei]|uniref:Uncharacterized protein n=1 Tax=Thelohanellus kitauei TaxID=669202 RepID=A0A0C2MDJ7_THEKT|nr:hypothetical protein RF11_02499 [Thelohanellus kitauei]